MDILEDKELEKRIKSIARKFYNVEKKDLYQAGYIGAFKASKKFDPTKDVNFYTYAYKYIFGEMHELSLASKNIRLNKCCLKIYKSIETARNMLTQKLKRIPSLDEISAYLEIDLQTILDIVSSVENIVSLDEENDKLNESNMYSVIGKEYDYDTKILINDSLEQLDELGKKVINYRYFKDYTQEETAEILGLSQVKVSRIETKSKKKIKEYICA